MAIDILAVDSDANRGETSKGATVVGFAARALARTFTKVADGLRVLYWNYPVIEPHLPAADDRRGDLQAYLLERHSNYLRVTERAANKKRGIQRRGCPRAFPMSRDAVNWGNLCWQVWVTACDLDQWAKNNARWLAAPTRVILAGSPKTLARILSFTSAFLTGPITARWARGAQ